MLVRDGKSEFPIGWMTVEPAAVVACLLILIEGGTEIIGTDACCVPSIIHYLRPKFPIEAKSHTVTVILEKCLYSFFKTGSTDTAGVMYHHFLPGDKRVVFICPGVGGVHSTIVPAVWGGDDGHAVRRGVTDEHILVVAWIASGGQYAACEPLSTSSFPTEPCRPDGLHPRSPIQLLNFSFL